MEGQAASIPWLSSMRPGTAPAIPRPSGGSSTGTEEEVYILTGIDSFVNVTSYIEAVVPRGLIIVCIW